MLLFSSKEVVSSLKTLRLLFKIVVALDGFCHSSAKMEQVLFRVPAP
ncbi:Uncharacterised protein [Segatella copri]|nr:Uncharacterised protein [Segatella copri]